MTDVHEGALLKPSYRRKYFLDYMHNLLRARDDNFFKLHAESSQWHQAIQAHVDFFAVIDDLK
jgi:hypothetical protein